MQVMQVTEFLNYLNETFKAIWDPQEVAIEGEVSGYRLSQGQWASFDLKDTEALVNVFLPVWKLHVPVQDGMRVRVFGVPRVYPKYGKFSFNAERVELTGEGSLQKALALLRQRFETEGLFDPSRKRPLPAFPTRIALIASRESAAYGDFIRILNERWGGLEIDSYHVLVQGERAPESIVRAMKQAGEGSYDVIVMTRGGGSLEELMAFNDERVVRAIFASPIPTLVAIGHERDMMFAEEVADVRGSTPTDCARRLVPDRKDVLYALAMKQEQITNGVKNIMNIWETTVDDAIIHVQHWVERLSDRCASLVRLVSSYDPRQVVKRGYAIVRTDQEIVTSINQIKAGAHLSIDVKDGKVESLVESVQGLP